MAEYFKNKYRINSLRLQDWDYSWPGLYFVTICTHGKVCCLGNIKNDNVFLSEIGKIIFGCWLEIPKHFNNTILDDWIIMPNHLHGIIVIKDNDFDAGHCRDRVYPVSTERKFGQVKSKSLSTIINNFKGAVTRNCNKNNLNFQWQKNYYEHIIKTDEDYSRIQEYSAQNPL
ncbi:MAG: transposase, partial [Candidatus Parcubacteria bacterium]|nr:transposase [Candidatus Parcubacteria bacterium]